MLHAFDPLVLHLAESVLGSRGRKQSLSFGESLDGTRDILIVAARELIDLLAIVPAARALRKRFPVARIHVLATERCAEVLAPRPEIFEVIPWAPDEEPMLSRAFFRRIRAARRDPFDLAVAVDSGEDRRARVLAALGGAKLRVGIHPDGADPTLNLVVSAPLVAGYRPVQSLEFLSFLGIPREQLAPSWEIPPADEGYAERLLNLRRKGNEGWLLGVDPGPGLDGIRPSPKKLAWLVERIVSTRGAMPLVLTEHADEEGVREFRSCLTTPLLEVSSRGIRDVLSFAKCCDFFLSGNTNLFHFAVGLGVPTIGVFGRDEDDRWIPRGRSACRVLRWKTGARVLERDFLDHVDAVRGAEVGEIPLRITLADDGEELAVDVVELVEAESGDGAETEAVDSGIRAN